jgi:GNAT superfamily N-acetyltransferase
VALTETRRIRERFTEQVRRGTVTDGLSEVAVTPEVVRWSASGDAGWSEISWSNLDEESADRVIAEQIRHFSSTGTGFVWRAYEGDRPDDLRTRLVRAGFTPDGTSELMIARALDMARTVELPDDVVLVSANDPDGISTFIAVHERVFEHDQSSLHRTLLFQQRLDPPWNEILIAMAGGEPVASARVQFVPDTDFAGLWGGSTLSQWRGKGLFRAMVARRAQIAIDRGYTYLFVVASNQSRPILERLSFVSFGSVATYGWLPSRAD